MKKKILGLLFVFCLIIPCAFMFVGCSDSDKLSKQVDELKQQVQTLTTEVDGLEQQLADLQSTNENLQSELNSITAFYELKKDLYSEMKNPYSVDTNQIFIATNSYSSGGTKSYTLGESSCLVFRTRTKLDEDGRLVSAHYGMIYGRWAIGFGMKAAAIFFNPRPNDTNIEDLDEFTRVRLKQNGLLK